MILEGKGSEIDVKGVKIKEKIGKMQEEEGEKQKPTRQVSDVSESR